MNLFEQAVNQDLKCEVCGSSVTFFMGAAGIMMLFVVVMMTAGLSINSQQRPSLLSSNNADRGLLVPVLQLPYIPH